MFKLKTKSSHFLYTLLVAVLFVGCKKEYHKKYIVSKSDDNNWTTTAVIECDSVSMIDLNTAILWSDNQKIILKGQIIKIFSNSEFVATK